MKTDLKKILSVSGETGLFRYVSQGKTGIIAEQLVDSKRKAFGMSAKVTSLSDISIYADDTEVKLQDVFLMMKGKLAEAQAPSPKSENKVLISFFEEVLPGYDRDRFYVSHMKKVVQWYNIILDNASFDFEEDQVEEGEENQAGDAS